MLSDTEKIRRKRDRMIEGYRQYTLGTVKNKVAVDFQRMIRAEAADERRGYTLVMVAGVCTNVWREVGECVCVTCGKVGWWKGSAVGGGTIETGHFLASRAASIVFEEKNAHPQCKRCNQHLSGNQSNYELYMQHVYGADEVDRLRKLKATPRTFTREELVDLRISFMARLKEAESNLTTRSGSG